jgi:hypothetical protein
VAEPSALNDKLDCLNILNSEPNALLTSPHDQPPMAAIARKAKVPARLMETPMMFVEGLTLGLSRAAKRLRLE